MLFIKGFLCDGRGKVDCEHDGGTVLVGVFACDGRFEEKADVVPGTVCEGERVEFLHCLGDEGCQWRNSAHLDHRPRQAVQYTHRVLS